MLQAAGHPARHADLMQCQPWGKIYCWPHRNVEVAFIHHGIPALADGCALHTLHAVDDGMIRPRATTTFFVLAAVLHVQVSHQGGARTACPTARTKNCLEQTSCVCISVQVDPSCYVQTAQHFLESGVSSPQAMQCLGSQAAVVETGDPWLQGVEHLGSTASSEMNYLQDGLTDVVSSASGKHVAF